MKTSTCSLLACLALPLLAACHPTSQPFTVAALGTSQSTATMEATLDQPGAVTVETVVSATWQVDRSGLINLDHPRAKAAHLVDGDEPIEIGFHAIRHPRAGLFLVDTGVERALVADRDHAALQGVVASLAHADEMKVRIDLASWLAQQPAAPAGVFLTHLHLDHVLGLRDVAAGTAVFVGPGENDERSVMNALLGPTFDRALEGKGALRAWRFGAPSGEGFAGVLDVFGDASVWALWVPGHTPGSTAFVVRTPTGPVLLTGDACHTTWGWENGVEPGTFSHDRPRSAVSLGQLRALAARHPTMRVRLGHQGLAAAASAP